MGSFRQEYWSRVPLPSPSWYSHQIKPNSQLSGCAYFFPSNTGKGGTISKCMCNQVLWVSLVAQIVKKLPECRRPGFYPWVEKIPWRREGLPTPVFGLVEFHGLYSPCGSKIQTLLSDFHFHFSGINHTFSLLPTINTLMRDKVDCFVQDFGKWKDTT